MFCNALKKYFDCTELYSEGVGGLGKMLIRIRTSRMIDKFYKEISNIFGTAEKNGEITQRFDLNTEATYIWLPSLRI